MPVTELRVAVDVGGTFTDVCVFEEGTSTVRVAKVPSTPDDPMQAVVAGAREAQVNLADVALFSHGTTVATNALITRRFPPAAMVTTRGFRDVIEIRTGTRDDLWDAYHDVAPPYIRRRDRFEVSERVDFAGRVVEPLDEGDARRVAALLRRKNVQTVAVCFVNSYTNGVNERRMREILEEELPGVRVSTSSEILPEIFEHNRFSTTVANAVLSPMVTGYVERLERRLAEDGYGGDLLLLHSGGGSMTPRMAQQYPVRLAGSGIAAGAIAARYLAQQCGFDNAIGLDMGGTSTDISLVYGRDIRVTKEWYVEYGYPICFPSIEVLTIGAGGGSLAWIDEAGSLRNGPQSAGAVPGPVCYDTGGTQPTNTDANLVLGRLGTRLVGGAMTLNRAAAERAIADKLAAPLELEPQQAAGAVIEVANANMADAVRLISIRRGYDPRDFALVVFGGAGALHGAALAKELSIPTVLVPPHPGITSALGCLLVDIRHDLTEMYQCPVSDADPEELEAVFGKLEAEARTRLLKEGVPDRDIALERSISMRYLGQWRSLAVSVGSGPGALDDAVGRFHREHEREYSFRRDDTPVEIFQLGLRAIGVTPKPSFAPHPLDGQRTPTPIDQRPVVFDEEPVSTPVYDRAGLAAGTRLVGPAVIEQLDATTVIPPDTRAEIDEWLNIRIQVGDGAI
ncbi:MAG: hydantoinase/oxoprolinase family protein [Streptosporangiales bacterium]|nr:hydantoinase/oxoprolinase family protein [Streptosporangiales bacterium]